MHVFGSGIIFATPTFDATGSAIANPSPIMLGTLQDTQVDIDRDLKMLYGRGSWAVDAAAGKSKAPIKAKFANINAPAFNTVYYGGAIGTAIKGLASDTATRTIPASSPYTITVTPPSSGTFTRDLGVINASTGRPYICVASAPTTGQYSVAAGVYTFAAADAGKPIYINYEYGATVTTAGSISVTNQPMGDVPFFSLDLFMGSGNSGKWLKFSFAKVACKKLGMSTKQDDFMIPDVEFEPIADVMGNVYSVSFAEG